MLQHTLSSPPDITTPSYISPAAFFQCIWHQSEFRNLYKAISCLNELSTLWHTPALTPLSLCEKQTSKQTNKFAILIECLEDPIGAFHYAP